MLIRQIGEDKWRSPRVTRYENEAAIELLLAKSPDLIPGVEAGGVAVAQQIELGAGYPDLVCVSHDGQITIVECKLKANPEIRRHVVGQILAYAATLWGQSYEEFDASFAARAGTSLSHAVEAIASDEWDEETFRVAVNDRLSRGQFRLVIAVDEITDELRQIVRFVNSHTSPELEVLAVELRYVSDCGVEILLPSVFGEESAASKATSTTGTKWNEATFFEALAKIVSSDELKIARRLYEFALVRGASFNWGVGPMPSMTARLPVEGKSCSVFSIYEWPKGSVKLTVNFEYIAWNTSESAMIQLAEDLRLIPGVAGHLIALEDKEFKQRPGIPLSLLVPEESHLQVEKAIDNLLGYRNRAQT